MPEGQTYIVQKGDSIPSIAKANGFFWKTIWNHGKNAGLKNKRKNPTVLCAGDEVFIPPLEKKTESKGSDSTHKFKVKGEPVKVAMKLYKSDGKPRANEAYELMLEKGKVLKGNTDGSGVLKAAIPNDLKQAMLKLSNGKEQHPLSIGGLDPVDEVSGIQHRLGNLGFDCPDHGDVCDATKRAIENFQAQNKLDVTGEVTDALKNKLLDFTQ